ncbi:MAG: hypothetical protein OEW18_00050 [Candidatus Aminicenantes bacterium]|nr:hypothetical protein [Candidatus Aminicenantes bacterium]
MTVLKWAVILSGLYSVVALTYLIFKARSFGRRTAYSTPQGSPSRGVIYALGKGMMPWEKESARLHILTYMGGMLYHIGIFAGFGVLLAGILSVEIPPLLREALRLCLALGLISGLGLLLKRLLGPHGRRLSLPDDFGANIFVDIFIAAALVTLSKPEVTFFFLAYSIFLLIYIPAGKIRHCFFFFYSRLLFGLFFGRRDVLPVRPVER